MVLDVNIDSDVVLTEVKKISANAALQRGDAALVATDDNQALLESFYSQTESEIVALVRRVKEPMVIDVPANWDASLLSTITQRLTDALTYGVLSHWYALSGESIYPQMFSGCIEEINRLLNRRKKPTR